MDWDYYWGNVVVDWIIFIIVYDIVFEWLCSLEIFCELIEKKV